MSALVITLPAERVDWGPVVQQPGGGCEQSAAVLQGGQLVMVLTLHWPTQAPAHPVVTHMQDRHAGPRD